MTLINHKFLIPSNITNLLLQQAEPATLALGLVMILLLGEIDLSVGAVSGFCAGIMASLSVRHGVNPILSILIAICVGALVGLFQSIWVVRFEIPAFIVTLAGLIAWQGGLFAVLGEKGTIGITDPKIEFLTQAFLSKTIGWLFILILILGFAFVRYQHFNRSRKLEINGPSLIAVVAQVMIFSVISGA